MNIITVNEWKINLEDIDIDIMTPNDRNVTFVFMPKSPATLEFVEHSSRQEKEIFISLYITRKMLKDMQKKVDRFCTAMEEVFPRQKLVADSL